MSSKRIERWRWISIFVVMSSCLFIGIGGVLLAIQSLMVMNLKSFVMYLACAPFWIAGHWLLKKLWPRSL